MPTPPSPLTAETDLVSFAIAVNGTTLAPQHQVLSIKVTRAADQVASAQLTLILTAPTDAAEFRVDQTLDIAAGYRGQNQPIFSGRIGQLTLRQNSVTALQLVIACQEALPVAARPDSPRPPVLTVTYGLDLRDFALEEISSGANAPTTGSPTQIRGTLRFQGSALARPGESIALAGFGGRFDGDAAIRGVTQLIEDGDWFTTVTVG